MELGAGGQHLCSFKKKMSKSRLIMETLRFPELFVITSNAAQTEIHSECPSRMARLCLDVALRGIKRVVWTEGVL